MQDLQKATSPTVIIGPCLDSSNVVYTTNLTNADLKLSKNGAAVVTPNTTATVVSHQANGFFRVTLDSTDTGTQGRLDVMLNKSGVNCPVARFMVRNTAWFNTVAGTGGSIPDAAAGDSGGLLLNGSNSGTVTLAALTVSGAVSFGSTFGVTGAVTLNSLTVSNATTFTGAVTMSSTFGVAGTTTLNALVVSTTTTLTGAVSLGSTVGITGAVTLTAGLSGTLVDMATTKSVATKLDAMIEATP